MIDFVPVIGLCYLASGPLDMEIIQVGLIKLHGSFQNKFSSWLLKSTPDI